jgi:hypothetical protein
LRSASIGIMPVAEQCAYRLTHDGNAEFVAFALIWPELDCEADAVLTYAVGMKLNVGFWNGCSI